MKAIVSSVATLIAASFLFAASVASAAAPTDLFFSEHVEGSGYSKAIEIYNGTGAAVDLSNYSVERYSNGNASTSGDPLVLSGTLADGDAYVIVNDDSRVDATLVGKEDIASDVANFNGDDLELLKHNGTVIDSFGQYTVRPTDTWGTTVQSKDHTLRRKSTICAGDTDDTDAFDPATEWDSFDQDDFSGLGSHTVSCAPTNDIVVTMASVSQAEGDSSATSFDFVVTLSQAAPTGGVTFTIATASSTATAPDDFIALPATSASIAAGATTYTASVQVNGDTTTEADEVFSITASNFTDSAGMTITPSVTATGTIENDDIPDLAIYQIQGTPLAQGAEGASPYFGQTVHTHGIVTVVADTGFYVQDAMGDGDPTTSDGVFVYTFDPPTSVDVGDQVEFDATVDEYYTLTELKSIANLVVNNTNVDLPTAVVLDASNPSPDPTALSCGASNFECIEGMRVSIADGFVTQGSQTQSAYGYVSVTADGQRSMREPGLLYGLTQTPGDNDEATIWDGNPEVFQMDPTAVATNGYDGNAIYGGSRFHGTGVMTYSFQYEFIPGSITFDKRVTLPRAVPDADPVILRIGEINVKRFCDDIDDIAPSGDASEIVPCADSGEVPSSAEYDLKTNRIAAYIGTVLDLPDVVALEEVENISALTKLADQLNTTYAITYTPKLIEGNDIGGIDVGYLVRTSRVRIDDMMQLGYFEYWTTPHDHWRPIFDHPPLVLFGTFIAGGQNQPFMVMVNHMKARQNVDDVTAGGVPTSDANEDNLKRLHQAYSVAQHVQDLQTQYPGVPLAVVGDFNAYQFGDGYVDIIGMITGHYNFAANLYDLTDIGLTPDPGANVNVVDPPLWNAVLSLPESEQYSYLFPVSLGTIQGSEDRKVATEQVLDHALLNEAARADFVRMDYGRANADAAEMDAKSGTTAVGVSDHDGFVIQLTFDRIFANGFEASN